MNELEMMSAQGLCELFMPKVAWCEAETGNNYQRKEKTAEYYYIGLEGTQSQNFWYKQIEKIVFPSGAKTKQEVNDIWIMVTAREMGYSLITNDGASKSQPEGILGKREHLRKLGVCVLRDFEAIELIKNEST